MRVVARVSLVLLVAWSVAPGARVAASEVRSERAQEPSSERTADERTGASDGATASAGSASAADPLEPPPPSGEAIASVLALFESGEVEAARAAALDLVARVDAVGERDPSRWSARDRALLDHTAALAAGALAEALFESDEPDWERIEQLEDEGAEAFERALSASVRGDGVSEEFGALRRRAAYGAGTLLAHGAERMVRRAQRLALMQPQEVPFAKETPERELVDAAFDRYERARAALLVRLELDWTDVDTRANLEWVQRRLAEIERLRERADEETERREEEQQQEEQQDEEQDEDGEEQDDQQDQQESESDDGDQEQDESSSESDSSDGDSSDDPSEDGEQQDEGFDDADQGDDDASQEQLAEDEPAEAGEEGEESDEESGDESDGATLETVEMSDVELRRLLQRLEEIDREGEATRRKLASSSRRRVERDW